MEPRTVIQRIEETAALPSGDSERFAGYAVIGLPFRSGHVLALRRFPASSVGPGYTSVWHRSPEGAWTFYSTVNPELGCSRYWGREVMSDIVAPIDIEWTGPTQFSVMISTALNWQVKLTESLPFRLMNAAAKLIPDAWWQRRFMLKAMGAAARIVLGTGKMNLGGKTPNDYEFTANPQRMWLIESSRAILNGIDLGPAGPLAPQAQLGEFLIPQRGLFAVARAFMRTSHQISSVLTSVAPVLSGPRQHPKATSNGSEDIGRNIPRAHAKWMGELLSHLSPEQIRDAFRAAAYTPQQVEDFVRVLEARITELRQL